MNDDKKRVETILSDLRLSKNSLGLSIGDKNGMRLTHVINGRNKISENLARDISNKYPQYNYLWILSGTGEMLNNDKSETKKNNNYLEHRRNKKNGDNINEVPVYDVDFIAGTDISTYDDRNC